MSIREDDRIEKTIDIDTLRTREELRRYMLGVFAQEECKTKTRYYVETLGNGKRIYLERPTALNKGCDFSIYVEDLMLHNNGNDRRPSHEDVMKDLTTKKAQLTLQEYNQLLQAIGMIYELHPYADAQQYVAQLPHVGWDYEVLLKLLRWLFTEQDITYWAGDGRAMLYDGILSTQ